MKYLSPYLKAVIKKGSCETAEPIVPSFLNHLACPSCEPKVRSATLKKGRCLLRSSSRTIANSSQRVSLEDGNQA